MKNKYEMDSEMRKAELMESWINGIESRQDREADINDLRYKELKCDIHINKIDSLLSIYYAIMGALMVVLIARFDIKDGGTWALLIGMPYLYFGYIRPEIKIRDTVAKNYNYYVKKIEEMYE